MTIYKAKKSKLKELLIKNNTALDELSAKTGISTAQLTEYQSKQIMSVNNAMTISKELNCSIEDLYIWNTKE
ncbi:Cro/C1-type HTH DNA-binding domain-containing protein [Bacillus sp. OV322]|uniref:helix-turn-helix domain-containing protein n=1 Tax=Bacillus sp. OV322 TaxID=1882764 RepID=UPI0008EF9DC1|nr:helix-turn-helix transcriptional regulator [Bacillus sp. OV322]SFC80323.1 Cro/C1-type HTH DNA-binding domain-containing protein [Bacillus sp. OV322]